MATKEETQVKEFVISRTFNAPRELVWKACSEPERMEQWFRPKGFTGRVKKMDFRPGGIYHYCLKSPEGLEMWGKCVYRQIQKPERIVFVNSFSDEKEGLTRHPMSPTWPLEMLSTFLLEERGGPLRRGESEARKTTLTVKWTPINPTPEERKAFDTGHDSMKQGWTGSLDQLTDYLAKQ